MWIIAKIILFIIGFIIGGGIFFVFGYLIDKGFANPLYVDWNSSSTIIWSSIGGGLYSGWLIQDIFWEK